MPVAINKHNVPSVMTDEQWEFAQKITPGELRLACEEDWAVLESERAAEFKCPWVWEHARSEMGDCPILIIGGGESMHGTVKDAYRMVCNPRPYSPKADAVVAIDSVYWTHGFPGSTIPLCEMYPYLDEADFFVGPAGPIPHSKQGKNQYRFGYPIFPLKVADPGTQGNPGLYLRVQNSIRNANICGIAAWLLARFLTNGPIIFTGFDLKGMDISGKDFDYHAAQIHKWTAVCDIMPDTYVHESNEGPLRNLFPVWRGE